ncbi:Pyridoxal-phosphate dependent enzyme [seawater metagenome]|uniref:threonine ammonia-lyase n=1 Tax=seawater metagenome TaxID=1561972 RepID=A0A5E8CLN8_9ZZZZ
MSTKVSLDGINKLYKTKELIDKASGRIYDLVKRTSLHKSQNLSNKNNIYFKREDEQQVFSFKIRGAYNKMLEIKNKDSQIYACSAGNHAQGVALAGTHLNFSTHIVMPIKTPEIKVINVKRFGGNVILFGSNFDEAKSKCYELAQENNGSIVDPFDDLEVIAGQGTVGKEIWEEMPNVDYIFAPIGGGGLISGVASYIKFMNPNIKVIGVQTYDSNGMYLSINEKEKIILPNVGLFSDGTAVKEVGNLTYEICQEILDDIVLVDTDDICLAIKDVYNDTRNIMEPAGALSVAGMKKYINQKQLNGKNIISILSGSNMDFKKISFVSDRANIKTKKEVLLAITIPEKPGTFLTMYNSIYPRNVLEFSYRYSNKETANIFISFTVDTEEDMQNVTHHIIKSIPTSTVIDISKDELAKTHLRFLMGGKVLNKPKNIIEKVYRFEFPEGPGALKKFLESLPVKWNVSLFHYKNYGDDIGRVLAGIQVPFSEESELNIYLDKLGYEWTDESKNIIYKNYIQ